MDNSEKTGNIRRRKKNPLHTMQYVLDTTLGTQAK